MSGTISSDGREKEDLQIPPFLLQSPSSVNAAQGDRGYLPKGVKRLLQDGKWSFIVEEDKNFAMDYCYSEAPYQEHDPFADHGIFPDGEELNIRIFIKT